MCCRSRRVAAVVLFTLLPLQGSRSSIEEDGSGSPVFFFENFLSIGNTRGWFWLTGFSKFFLVLEISGRWCIRGECVIRGKWGISGESGKFCAYFF